MESVFTWLANLFKKNNLDVSELKNAKFTSKRVWLMVAAIVGVIMFPTYFNQLGWQLTVLGVAFIIGDSWTAGKTIDANAKIRHNRQKHLAEKNMLIQPQGRVTPPATPPTA